MEYFDDMGYEVVDEQDIDSETETLLKTELFIEWSAWRFRGNLYSKTLVDYHEVITNEIISESEIIDRIRERRGTLIDDVKLYIDYHLEEENYELIPQIKAKCMNLHAQGIKLEERIHNKLKHELIWKNLQYTKEHQKVKTQR